MTLDDLMDPASEEEVPQPGNRRAHWWIAAALAAVAAVAVAVGVTVIAGSAVSRLEPEQQSCFLKSEQACASATPESLKAQIEQQAGIVLPDGAELLDSYSQQRALASGLQQVAVFRLDDDAEVTLGLRFETVSAGKELPRLEAAARRAGITEVSSMHSFWAAPSELGAESAPSEYSTEDAIGEGPSEDATEAGIVPNSTISVLQGTNDEGSRLALILVDRQ